MINVLLVEDDAGDALLLEEAMELTQFDNKLHHSLDGLYAKEFLEDESKPKPDIILLDINMPRMNGHEFLHWIKHHEQFRTIPVGMLTTSSCEDDIEKSYKNYASYYIVKPTTFDDLQSVVEMIDAFWRRTVKLMKAAS